MNEYNLDQKVLTNPALVAYLAAEARVKPHRFHYSKILDMAYRKLCDLAQNTDVRPKDAAHMLGCSKRTIARMITDGKFPGAYWINSRVCKIPRADIEALKVNPVHEAHSLLYPGTMMKRR